MNPTFKARFSQAKGQRSAASIAAALHVSRRAVEHWVNGRVPRSDHLSALAALLEVSVDWLLGQEGRPDPAFLGAVSGLAEFGGSWVQLTEDQKDVLRECSRVLQSGDARMSRYLRECLYYLRKVVDSETSSDDATESSQA